jgi:hypothetical protein
VVTWTRAELEFGRDVLSHTPRRLSTDIAILDFDWNSQNAPAYFNPAGWNQG